MDVAVIAESGEDQKIVPWLTKLSITPVCAGKSDVGPLNCCKIHAVGQFIQLIICEVILPSINKELSNGFALPSFLVNTSVDIDLEGNATRLDSDVDLVALMQFLKDLLGLQS